MNECQIILCGAELTPLSSGAIFWAAQRLLVVSDLHLGRSDRIARRSGVMLPPYETRDTLARLSLDLDRTNARTVLCLGDSFDDLAAATSLTDDEVMALNGLQAGRRWIWIEGNHDPGPVDLGGTHLASLEEGPLTFRHIARHDSLGEVSGHYHPKAQVPVRGRLISRPCFLFDAARLILPAYGTYTGGLPWSAPELRSLFGQDANAILLGDPLRRLPAPGSTATRRTG